MGIQVIAVDGKVPMAPMTANQAPKPYTWSVWASEHRLVLAQAKVQDKSNEITAIPASGVA